MLSQYMLSYLSCATAFAALLLPSGYAQQFSDLPIPPSWPGISNACFDALNTTVSCPGFLGVVSIKSVQRLHAFSSFLLSSCESVKIARPDLMDSNERLAPQNLTSLCVASCLTSLNNIRGIIQQGCTASADQIVYDDVTYPGKERFFAALLGIMLLTRLRSDVSCRPFHLHL